MYIYIYIYMRAHTHTHNKMDTSTSKFCFRLFIYFLPNLCLRHCGPFQETNIYIYIYLPNPLHYQDVTR